MYIIERLLADYPEHAEDIRQFGKYLESHVENARQIADDGKPNFKWVDAAYRAGPDSTENSEYIRNMAFYEFSLNYDLDFLKTFVPEDERDGATVDGLRRKLLGDKYDEARELINKEKLGIR